MPIMGRRGRAAFRTRTGICRPGTDLYSWAHVCRKYRQMSVSASPVSEHLAAVSHTSITGSTIFASAASRSSPASPAIERNALARSAPSSIKSLMELFTPPRAVRRSMRPRNWRTDGSRSCRMRADCKALRTLPFTSSMLCSPSRVIPGGSKVMRSELMRTRHPCSHRSATSRQTALKLTLSPSSTYRGESAQCVRKLGAAQIRD